jgi:outer membrane protein OmpA-like peptidoglycan-associated protein
MHFLRIVSILACVLWAPSLASAESGTLNLHIEPGLGFPAGDYLEEDPMTMETSLKLAAYGTVGLDWQLAQPFALELMLGGGYAFDPFPDEAAMGEEGGTPYFTAAVGGRYRFLDNEAGYANEDGGDYAGNAYVNAHLGYHLWDGSQFGVDLGAGYEWSIMRPMSIGLFVRGALLFGNDNDMRDKIDAHVYGGVSFSFELIGGIGGEDTDGDGLTDWAERDRHRTNPDMPDTDQDALNDGLEVETSTDPLSSDTDGDGLVDGAEDANHNGAVDAGETDPRIPDTDRGGVPDGWEVQNSRNALDPADDDSDRDGVLENVDECPNTPEGETVDERGCIVMRERITLDGITFAFDSAEILPASEQTLQRALQILKDNPDVRVEVAGHTDNVGNANYNRNLSRQRAGAVREWLVGQGIDGGRMTVRGYGSSQPATSNDTEEGRAQNRRIEFRTLEE